MRQMNVVLRAAAAVAAFLVLTPNLVPAALAESCATVVNLKQTAERTGVLKEMAAATHLAGLDDTGVDVGALTLLAPTDEAFNALPPGFRERLLAPENRQHLTALLMHHAVLGEYSIERLKKAKATNFTIPAVDGSGVEIFTGRGLNIEGARILEGDIRATDGVIHLIDKVLVPPSVMTAIGGEDFQPAKVAATAEE